MGENERKILTFLLTCTERVSATTIGKAVYGKDKSNQACSAWACTILRRMIYKKLVNRTSGGYKAAITHIDEDTKDRKKAFKAINIFLYKTKGNNQPYTATR